MKVKSRIVKIPKTNNLTAEYIEQALTKQSINPLRWAIVNVNDNVYTVSIADLLEE